MLLEQLNLEVNLSKKDTQMVSILKDSVQMVFLKSDGSLSTTI